MVDAERLHRLLRRVADDVARLRAYREVAADDLLADEVRLGHCKYLFITAIEGCIDAAQHICATEGYGPPETNADAMRLLGRHGVLADDLAHQMAAAVAFRNLLVHGYAEIDDTRVVANLARLGDLDRYVDALAGLIGDR